jgi:hypothetical protein
MLVNRKKGRNRRKETGFLTILDCNDEAISNPGCTKHEYVNGVQQRLFPSEDKVFDHGQDVLADEERNLYIGLWNSSRIAASKTERV